MRFKILLIAIMIIAAILVYFLYKQINIPAPILQAEPLRTKASLIGTVQETRQVSIGSQDYIDKYIDWQFTEINSTHWTADFSFTEPFFSDSKICLNDPQNVTCWNSLKDNYFQDYNLNKVRSDLLNLTNYPLRNLTKDISFSNFQIDLTSGTGSFTINFPNGFKEGEYAELGFGSTVISTTTTTLVFLGNMDNICRTTNMGHIVYVSGGIFYANFTTNASFSKTRMDGSGGGDDAGTGTYAAIACSGNRVFIVWNDGANDLRYMNSTDEGATWTSNVTVAPLWIAGTYAPRNSLSASYGADDNIWVVSVDDQGANETYTVFNSTLYGAGSPTLTINAVTNDINSGGSGAVYVSKEVPEKIFLPHRNNANNRLEFNRSLDGGATWSGTNINTGNPTQGIDVLEFNSTLLFVAFGIAGDDVYIANSTNNGTTWGTSVRLDTIGAGTSIAQQPTLATDYTNLYVFWQQNDTTTGRYYDIYYRKWNQSYGWDSVTLWQSLNSSLDSVPNAKYNASKDLIEVVFVNRTATSGNVEIRYDFINTTYENIPPKWSLNQTNSTTAGSWVNHSVFLSDDIGLDYYIFEFDNGTSTLTNISTVDISGTQVTANQTVLINSTIGSTIRWRYYFNDTKNNWNSTDLFTYTTTTDTTKPTWSNNATNSTLAGTWVDHSVVLSDDVGLSFYFFEFDNGTGSLNNITNMSISGSQVTANQTVLINSTFNSTVRWRYYFNDTSNNWNSTYLFNYTTSGIILSFVPPTQDNATTIAVNSTYINVSVTQNTSAIDTILFQWNFSGKNTNVTIYNTSELVGLWHLNNDTLDYSGNGNDLTLANGVNCSTNVQGKFGMACDFAGDDDRLDGGSNSSIDDIFTGGGTAMAWIYLDSYGTNNQAYIAGKGTPGTSGWIFWVVNSMGQNAIQFNTYFSTFGAWIASDELSTGRWIHVAVMYNDGATTNDPVLYVNGKNVTIDSETTPTGTYQSDAANNTFIGGTPTGNTRNFNGTIDEVRFYKRILSSDEINITYRSELGKYINSTVFFQNFTDMADGAYRYKSYGKMTDGTWNSSEERTLTVAIPPIWSNNQSSIPSKYSTALSIFNITWTDNAAISIAFLESNFSGSPTNYTMWSTGNVYNYNNTLPAGSFYWKSYANDTTNNWNVSDTWYFTIDKGTLELSITSPQTVTYPAQTTVTGSEANTGDTDVTYQLWRNSSATNPLSLTTETNALGVGAHLYTYNTTAGTFANWTVNTTGVNTTVTVSQNQTNPINIFFTNSTGTYQNQNITVAYGESTTANATLVYSNAGTASLFEDNSSVANPRTTTLSVGNHSYKGNTSGNVNHTANATGAIYYITVTPVVYTISINLNATQVWWNDSVNLSGYATSTGSPFSGWIQVNRSNDTTTMCNTTTSNGYYSCVFYAPLEIGNYNYTSYMLSQTGSALVGNSTILTVMLSYGSEYPGKNVGVYEAPVIIQELSGKIKIVWVKIKTWFNR